MKIDRIKLAIDYNGVVHDQAHPIAGRRMGGPLPDSKAALTALYNSGYEIIIFTDMAQTDGGRKAVEDWMIYYGIPYHSVTAIKPSAAVYLDDKAIRFENWEQAIVDINKVLNANQIKNKTS